MPLMRIPYTSPLPPPTIIPASANNRSGAIAALCDFLNPPPSSFPSASRNSRRDGKQKTILLTGAGISVASGLADYRGTAGTYTLNKTYRPIYFHEFVAKHEARKRYWARSFLGWTNLNKARANAGHVAVGKLGSGGWVGGVITQSMYPVHPSLVSRSCEIGSNVMLICGCGCADVDSFHNHAHPALPTIELHGYLRSLVCLSCRTEYPRAEFQKQLAALNPAWAAFLEEMLQTGALDTEHPDE
ncbi:hypothetical protein LTS18_000371, partial [Coniosporium uncinatum]